MLTEVYISVSDQKSHLVIDGSLELLDRLLSTLRTSKDDEPYPTEAKADAQPQAREVRDGDG